jgi:hypothetical protein
MEKLHMSVPIIPQKTAAAVARAPQCATGCHCVCADEHSLRAAQRVMRD